jgi:hypothetical protein
MLQRENCLASGLAPGCDCSGNQIVKNLYASRARSMRQQKAPKMKMFEVSKKTKSAGHDSDAFQKLEGTMNDAEFFFS